KYKFEVGIKSMKILANILHGTADTHLIQVTLETLSTLVTHDITSDKEMYIDNKENVHVLLEYIIKSDFIVRRAAIQFLTAITINCMKELQNIIFETPSGISKLVYILKDKHENLALDVSI
ncbi:unnamed protein product, partial [Rotaria sp. Silwood1]